jgi:hypothetical protein
MIKPGQIERRSEPRLLCSDLVTVEWTDRTGATRKEIANLEDISAHGVCLQTGSEIPAGTAVRITAGDSQLCGNARYCREDELGCYVGVQMEPGSEWSEQSFQPKHLLDPRLLLVDKALRSLKT